MVFLAAVLAMVLTFSGCFVIMPGGLLGSGADYAEMELQSGSSYRKILVLDVDGAITSGPQSSPGLFGGGDSTVNEVAEKLAKARKDHSIKAVVLRVDSPGGGVTASDVIHRLIAEYKKETGVPVYVSMLDMATSGGYYISMAADKVYAHPTTITGSIGVIAIFPQFQDLGRNIGVYMEIIKSGDNKDLTGGFVNMTPEQRAILQQMIDDMYGRFVAVVKEGRPALDEARIRELADGRIYTANEAVENGLIDGVKYTDEVIKIAQTETGSPKARVVLYRRTGRNSVESVYARTPPLEPTATQKGGDLNLINIDAASMSFPGSAQPVFQYVWMP